MNLKAHFEHRRRICFYETDAMGVVHHSNYLRFFEEARMHWYNAREVHKVAWGDQNKATLAVIECGMTYKAPARYNEHIEVRMQVKQEGSCVRFQYSIWSLDHSRLLTSGFTLHVPVNEQMKACKIPQGLRELLKEEPWTETWP